MFPIKTIYFLIVFLVITSLEKIYCQKPEGLSFAHAHNDYAKLFRKDFKDALKAGCSSIEIDVFPYRNKLVVAHIPLFLWLRRDIEKRYFKPLKKYIDNQNGSIFNDSSKRLILMVDVKRNSTEAYHQLKQLAKKYESILTVWNLSNGQVKNGPLEILISGSKPYREVGEDSILYFRLDGGLGDIGNSKFNGTIVPRVSSSYGSNFKWRGFGKMPEKELEHLRKLVKMAHEDKRAIRFWAMPNQLKVWRIMLKEGVDWLNIDQIKKLKKL